MKNYVGTWNKVKSTNIMLTWGNSSTFVCWQEWPNREVRGRGIIASPALQVGSRESWSKKSYSVIWDPPPWEFPWPLEMQIWVRIFPTTTRILHYFCLPSNGENIIIIMHLVYCSLGENKKSNREWRSWPPGRLTPNCPSPYLPSIGILPFLWQKSVTARAKCQGLYRIN